MITPEILQHEIEVIVEEMGALGSIVNHHADYIEGPLLDEIEKLRTRVAELEAVRCEI